MDQFAFHVAMDMGLVFFFCCPLRRMFANCSVKNGKGGLDGNGLHYGARALLCVVQAGNYCFGRFADGDGDADADGFY